MYSGFKNQGLRIPQAKLSRIPESGFPYQERRLAPFLHVWSILASFVTNDWLNPPTLPAHLILNTKRYLLALGSWGEFIKFNDSWIKTLVRTLKGKPVDHRRASRTTACFTNAGIKTRCGHWLHPNRRWIVDFDMFASMAQRCKHLYISRTLELSFERNGLAAMVVLGCVGNIDLSSLKYIRLNTVRAKEVKSILITLK